MAESWADRMSTMARNKVAGSKPPESAITLSDMVKVVMLKVNL